MSLILRVAAETAHFGAKILDDLAAFAGAFAEELLQAAAAFDVRRSVLEAGDAVDERAVSVLRVVISSDEYGRSCKKLPLGWLRLSFRTREVSRDAGRDGFEPTSAFGPASGTVMADSDDWGSEWRCNGRIWSGVLVTSRFLPTKSLLSHTATLLARAA